MGQEVEVLLDWLLLGAVGDRPAPIVNGDILRDEHPEVVALAAVDPETGEAWVFCSGSQVQASWVLTAAHCLDEGAVLRDEEGLDLAVLWGGELASGPVELRHWDTSVAEPGWAGGNPLADIGLVRLSEPMPGRWMVLSDEPMDETWVGEPIELFGFGVTSELAGDAGTKRSTTVPITGVEPLEFEAYDPDTNLCYGDSGGPSTVAGEQVGVNNRVQPSCIGGSSGSVRVDAHLDWIRSVVPDVALDASDLPPAPRAEGGEVARGGCSTAPGVAGWWLLPIALLARRSAGEEGPGKDGSRWVRGMSRSRPCRALGQRSARRLEPGS